MKESLSSLADFLLDLERLKLVQRKAYVSDLSRHENSAEHSWHLAVSLMALARELDLTIDLGKALKLALVHDVCEIDAGDFSIYDPARKSAEAAERVCIQRLAGLGGKFGKELQQLWMEYEAQETLESRWVRVLDRVLPFLINLATGGRTWLEQSISRSQLLAIHEETRKLAPEIHAWMLPRIDACVAKGWLRNA